MGSSAGEGGSINDCLNVSTAYMEVASPRLPSSATSSRAVNLRRRKIEIEIVEGARQGPTWQFPGSGSNQHVQVPQGELGEIQKELNEPKKLLGELPATSICGNDILSSVLYSSSSVAAKSGKLLPIPLIMVAAVLYFFRFIYEEVVTAIPMNGGTYNALLNTTSKRTAAVAACLSILSYIATGVVSATSGVRYLNNQIDIPIVVCTIILLGAFALLAIVGITESSRVATFIFIHHIIVLVILLVSCVAYGVQHTHIFSDNMHTSLPEVDFGGSMLDGNVFTAIFFGFGASMLGITGFESSSNYVEEQAPGVFRKTLRNMWTLVTFFNVGLGIGILAVLPLEDIYAHEDALLAAVGRVAVGSWFEVWVCIDAFVVLSGAVLTSYVGDPKVLMYFAIYFIVVMLAMFVMFERVTILRYTLVLLKKMAPSRYGKAATIGLSNDSSEVEHTGARGGRTIARTIVSIRDAPIVFFCKVPDLTIINKAIIYVRRNEQTHTLRIVHVFSDEEADTPVLTAFREMVTLFDSMYPKIRVDFVSVQGEFSPAMIEWLSRSMKVPRNMMFITQPDFLSAERVSSAGVRVITA
ncbi:hypothetical protein BBJ29_005916 [Phytophthora kernoviae]|uniref:Amino acid permease/ SLC12A domain-containing protein n=1 Tax=Phytophthora kernoviae TaxID=325452 RepID=A0A3F2RHC5_9STRA|nr:hypothetical protein BBP00_00007751 [Phytophthora kernoviae]RLN60475.1 hypothetical protein BBJ29_005916 [Phytophthora kernoviae]